MLSVYVYTKLGDTRKANVFTDINCQEYNGLSCWYKMQSSIWQNFDQKIKDKKEIAPFAHNEINALKQVQKRTSLVEHKTISQEEIEELDFGYYKY